MNRHLLNQLLSEPPCEAVDQARILAVQMLEQSAALAAASDVPLALSYESILNDTNRPSANASPVTVTPATSRRDEPSSGHSAKDMQERLIQQMQRMADQLHACVRAQVEAATTTKIESKEFDSDALASASRLIESDLESITR